MKRREITIRAALTALNKDLQRTAKKLKKAAAAEMKGLSSRQPDSDVRVSNAIAMDLAATKIEDLFIYFEDTNNAIEQGMEYVFTFICDIASKLSGNLYLTLKNNDDGLSDRALALFAQHLAPTISRISNTAFVIMWKIRRREKS